jgi:hypothetical protein
VQPGTAATVEVLSQGGAIASDLEAGIPAGMHTVCEAMTRAPPYECKDIRERSQHHVAVRGQEMIEVNKEWSGA